MNSTAPGFPLLSPVQLPLLNMYVHTYIKKCISINLCEYLHKDIRIGHVHLALKLDWFAVL